VDSHGHGRLDMARSAGTHLWGGVMNRTNRTNRTNKATGEAGKLAASVRLDQQAAPGVTRASGVAYRRRITASAQLFATPPVDLTTLVIAQEIKRKAQAELQREVLRDTVYQYDMPVSRERNDERNGWNTPAESDQ
jgi:hypothetical protein